MGKSIRKCISEIMTNYVKIYTIDFAIQEGGIIHVQVKLPLEFFLTERVFSTGFIIWYFIVVSCAVLSDFFHCQYY